MQRYCQRAQNHQVYLNVMSSAALSYAKISPTSTESSSLLECYVERRLSYAKVSPTNAESSSLLECYVERSFILCKDTLLSFNVKINATIIYKTKK